MSGLASVGRLQRHLEQTYDVAIPQAVGDYVISSRALLSTLLPEHTPGAREQLLVVERSSSLDVGLFLDEDVLAAFLGDDPVRALHEGNLESFCVVLEGVSHFLYLLWKRSYSRSVSLLELELQAEVDKYFTAASLFARQSGSIPEGLVERLFGSPRYLETLTPGERERYETANRYAAKLCLKLDRFLRDNSERGAMQALRRFYRLGSTEKLRYVEQV